MYVLLHIDNDDEVLQLLRDMAEFPGQPILTPGLENLVHTTIIDISTENNLPAKNKTNP